MNTLRCWTVSAVGLLAGATYAAQSYADDQVLLKVKPGYSVDLVAQAAGATIVDRIPQLGIVKLQLNKVASVTTSVARFKNLSAVAIAEPNIYRKFTATVNDPSYSKQYAPGRMLVPKAWDLTFGLPSVVVAVIDSGVDYTHPDLSGKIIKGPDYGEGDLDPMDAYGHGTHCAGIIGASTNNGVGIAGVGYNVRVLALKIADKDVNIVEDAILKSLAYAADNGADVISMSFGGYTSSASEETAIDYAWNKGVLLLAAAGNDNTSTPMYPAGFTHVISVGSTDANDVKSSFSNWGTTVDVAAPGSDIYSTLPSNSYGYESGTSMACPNAAGVAALMISRAGKGKLTNAQLRTIMESNTTNVGTWLRTGRVDAYRDVYAAAPPTYVAWPLTTLAAYGNYTTFGTASYAKTANDNLAFVVKSNAVSGSGYVADALATYSTVSVTPSTVSAIDVKIRAKSATGASGILWLWNYTTSKFEQKATFAMSTAYADQSITISGSPSDYIKNKKVQVAIRAIQPSRVGTGNFDFSIDYIAFRTGTMVINP